MDTLACWDLISDNKRREIPKRKRVFGWIEGPEIVERIVGKL